MPKSTPLLFKPEMFRACLSGAKTMTRRIVDTAELYVIPRHAVEPDIPQVLTGVNRRTVAKKDRRYKAKLNKNGAVSALVGGTWLGLKPGEFDFVCPYATGTTSLVDGTWTIASYDDEIWAKETWRPELDYKQDSVKVTYAADGAVLHYRQGPIDWKMPKAAHRSNVSPLCMPRWAARIVRPLNRVRLEFLQSITAKDILAEGAVLRPFFDVRSNLGKCPISVFDNKVYPDLQSLWIAGWNGINKDRAPWSSNPLVWVPEWQ